MDSVHAAHAALERIALDPKYHEILTLVKGIRNGIVYGTKVRFPHALVMIFLFRSGTLRQKLALILKATRQHARNLGLFALIYKTTMLLLRHSRAGASPKEAPGDSFLAGLLGGYVVFGRSGRSSVNQQIVIYVFARVALAAANLLVANPAAARAAGRPSPQAPWTLLADERRSEQVRRAAWPLFASLSWAAVMWLFRHYPEAVQPSMRSSMQYIYVQSDHWDSLRTLLWHNK